MFSKDQNISGIKFKLIFWFSFAFSLPVKLFLIVKVRKIKGKRVFIQHYLVLWRSHCYLQLNLFKQSKVVKIRKNKKK